MECSRCRAHKVTLSHCWTGSWAVLTLIGVLWRIEIINEPVQCPSQMQRSIAWSTLSKDKPTDLANLFNKTSAKLIITLTRAAKTQTMNSKLESAKRPSENAVVSSWFCSWPYLLCVLIKESFRPLPLFWKSSSIWTASLLALWVPWFTSVQLQVSVNLLLSKYFCF